MEINDFEIVWLYVVDSGQWSKKREDLKVIIENLMNKTRTVDGIIRYYTPKELEELAGSEEKRADIRVKNEKIKEILDIYYKSDIDNIDPEYLENLSFFRAKLTGFKIVLPDNRVEPVQVRLLFHKSGIFILEFNLKIKDMAITPEIINELQLIPRAEEELTLKVPRKLFRDYSLINPESANLAGKEPEDEDEFITIKFTFHEIVWIYWAIIAHIVTNEKAKDSKELHHSLRYGVFHFFPILIFHFPEIPTIRELLDKYKKELFSILNQEIYVKPEYLRIEIIDETFDFKNNLADRIDYALYFSMESSILLYSQKTKSVLEFLAKKRSISVDKQLVFEKLDLLLVLEFLHLQQFILMMYDFLLSRRSVADMDIDELAQMRGLISKAIEEFHNVKLAVKTITIKRLERGHECFKLDKSLLVLEKKLEIIDAAVSSIHNSLMEFLNILIGVLVAVGPIIALAIGQDYPVIASCMTFAILLCIYILYKKFYKIWYKRLLGKKKKV